MIEPLWVIAPDMEFINVLFPAPLLPIRQVILPFSITISIPLRASMGPVSYTHLLPWALPETAGRLMSQGPLWYAHSDVYKRQ